MAEIADLLAHPAVAALLIAIGLTGIAVELMSPGFGVPGAVGLGAFAAFFWAQGAAGEAGWGPPVLFAAGLALLVLEVFLPTLGILGVVGFLTLTAGIVFAASNVWTGLASLGAAVVITAAALWGLFRLFGWKPSWNKLVLSSRQSGEEGYLSNRDRRGLLGKTGVTLTVLRPAGFAEIAGKREDVVSEGEIIPERTKIRVVHVEGPKVVVKRAESEEG